MEFKELHYKYTTSAAQCVREVISPLPFYNQEARTKEINKFNSDNLWTFVGDKDRCNIVAIENGEVVGFLFGVVDANVLFVIWIGMKEKYRRTNHMRTLWELMEEWCTKKGISKVWCDTNQHNIPSIQFVQKMGYTKLADLKNFWYGHDYFLWEKTIDGKPNGEL
jgi:ribosomal protein S18 acetylase RimI-like enzyme